jgi:hypothetical protein
MAHVAKLMTSRTDKPVAHSVYGGLLMSTDTVSTFKADEADFNSVDPGRFRKLVILHHMCGGNTLYFYDEYLHLITDQKHLLEANAIYVTNYLKRGYELDGLLRYETDKCLVHHMQCDEFERCMINDRRLSSEHDLLLYKGPNTDEIVELTVY